MSRPCRHSDAGKDRSSRRSRAGETGRTGHYVRSAGKPSVPQPGEAPGEPEDDGAHWQQPSRKPVTLATLKFLERKKIGGEVI
jgi:hypothetical protein